MSQSAEKDAGYVLMSDGRILGQVTTTEARQMIALMDEEGAPSLARAFAEACGLTRVIPPGSDQ